MSIYVITGGTTGIGAATREKLQEQGHEVFNIDYKGGDYTADLSTKEGRKEPSKQYISVILTESTALSAMQALDLPYRPQLCFH